MLDQVREVSGDVLIFSSGHFLQVLAARLLELELRLADNSCCARPRLSALSYEHDLSSP
jgi:probable phosphoglycerate mutase